MKSKRKKQIALLLAMVLSSQPFYSTVYAEEELQDIQMQLEAMSDVDIALAIGKTAVDAKTFEADLRAKLNALGVNDSRIKIDAIESNQVVADAASASQIFSQWKAFTINGNNSSPNDFYISGDRIVRSSTGNTRPAQGYYDSNVLAKETQDAEYNFSWGIHPSQYGSFSHGESGFMFRMQDENNYYAYLMDNHSACGNIFMDGGEALVRVVNGSYQVIASKSGFPTFYPGQKEDIKIVTKGSNIQVFRNGNKVLETNDTTYKKGTQGFYVWDQYGAYFSNISLSSEKTKEFKDVIKEPKWREGSERFLLNLDDIVVPDFSDSYGLGEILPRLINDDVSYVGLGTSANKAQMESFVKKNNGKGTVLSNQNYNQMIEDTANYIFSQLKLKSGRGQYVLVNEKLDVTVSPEELKNNSQTPEYPSGRWRLDHDYDFFDNSMGESPINGFYQQNLTLNFDKVGRYDVKFGDQTPIPESIFVHREPVAAYSSDLVKSGSTFTLNTEDFAYDLDRLSQTDKGIKVRNWKWKRTTDESWTNGKPATLPANGDYLVQYQVEDYQGQLSKPSVRYFTTTNRSARPIANFTVTPNPVSIYDTVTHSNTSYDPAGKPLTEYEWTFLKDGVQIYKGNAFQQNFISNGSGNYRISLRVKNGDNLWSEEFVRNITVTKDDILPTLVADLTSHKWTKNNILVQMIFDDKGGSGFKQQRVAISQSETKPTSGWSSYSSSRTHSETITKEGKNYIHIEASDIAGNTLNKVLGPYQIDRSSPTGADFTFDGTNPNQGLTIHIHGKDELSGIKKIVHPNLAETLSDKASHVVTNPGEYKFKIIDAVGNEKEVSTVVESPNFTIEEEGLNLKVTINKKYSGIGLVQDTNSGETKSGNVVRFPINGNGHYAYRVNDGGIWSDQKIYHVKNFHELLAPRISLAYDKNWTNKSIVVQVTAYSNSNKGISHIVLPNGNQVFGLTSNFTITENGVYTFYAVDNDGTFGYQSIQVKNIDKKNPDITLLTPSDWVNKDVEIKFIDNEEKTTP